jgi:hypothetical protein
LAAQQILEDAREALANGWVKGSGGGKGGNVCIREAIFNAAATHNALTVSSGGHRELHHGETMAIRRVAELLPDSESVPLSISQVQRDLYKIINWNDRIALSYKDVLRVMDEAIRNAAPAHLVAPRLSPAKFVTGEAMPPLDPPLTVPEEWTVEEKEPVAA